jgi:hypothetical protein
VAAAEVLLFRLRRVVLKPCSAPAEQEKVASVTAMSAVAFCTVHAKILLRYKEQR